MVLASSSCSVKPSADSLMVDVYNFSIFFPNGFKEKFYGPRVCFTFRKIRSITRLTKIVGYKLGSYCFQDRDIYRYVGRRLSCTLLLELCHQLTSDIYNIGCGDLGLSRSNSRSER